MTDPGQRILPGADLGREVPLPPQPPLEDESPLRRTIDDWPDIDGPFDEVLEQAATEGMQRLSGRPPVESPDLPIPAEALEVAAKAACEATYPPSPNGRTKSNRSWEEIEGWEQDAWRRTTEAALSAALPHLRSLQVETQIEFGRALGRREAAEWVVEAFLNAARGDETGLYLDIDTACTLARDAAKGDPK